MFPRISHSTKTRRGFAGITNALWCNMHFSAMFKKCRRLLQSWPYSLGSKSKRSEFYIFLQKAEIFFVCCGADEDHCIKNKERETLEVKNVFIIAIPVFRSLSIERKSASAGNRTRVNCLEGSYAHHYTTDAVHGGKLNPHTTSPSTLSTYQLT